MAKLGTITFQAMDNCDIFLETDVYLDGVTDTSDTQATFSEAGIDTDKAWITGNVPRMIPVDVDGDTAVIYGWYKGKSYPGPFKLKVYVEYEEVEELIMEEAK